MKTRTLLIPLIFLLLACQLFSGGAKTQPPAAPGATSAPGAANPGAPSNPPLPTAAASPAAAHTGSGQPLAPFTSNTAVFAQGVALKTPPTITGNKLGPNLPASLDSAANLPVTANLTAAQQKFLAQNGFAALHTGDAQFMDVREQVGRKFGQPYYLTTDDAYHALHLTFDELLKALERERLSPLMLTLLKATLEKVQGYQQPARGTSLEADSNLAAGYLGVAIKLFDPSASLDAALEKQVAPQLAQVRAMGGVDQSKLIPGFKDDYGSYKPVGHYAGDPALEAYFQGMTWLGRVPFMFKDPSAPNLAPSRAPLLITLALRQITIPLPPPLPPADLTPYFTTTPTPSPESISGAGMWSQVHEMLTFIIGPSDDPGPAELAALMDKVYSPTAALDDLKNDALWQQFLQQVDSLPAPQINSLFIDSLKQAPQQRGWRFLGQRFTLDSYILQNLVYDRVGTQEKQRVLPSGLDVMAAFGSKPALQALQDSGDTGYTKYMDQMAILQAAVNKQPEVEWTNRFYSGWLYAFFPQLLPREDSYPAYMRSAPWGFKELNSALGSWAELKHDTALYTKMPMGVGGGGPPLSGPPPSFVEPDPAVFYRLSAAARSLVTGLAQRGIYDTGEMSSDLSQLNANQLLNGMSSLAGRFETLGDIAGRELQGTPPTQDEWDLINSCLGPLECAHQTMLLVNPNAKLEPLPVVAAVAGAGSNVLEAGVGKLDRLYVLVPYGGQLWVAQGSVFSYYEFTQPGTNRLTDEQWRTRLDSNPPQRPAWTQQYILPGGQTKDWLAFRVNDVYIVTRAGGSPPLNLRAAASKSAAVVDRLIMGTYLTIIGGPVKADGFTWWQVTNESKSGEQGWVVENQDWYVRSYSANQLSDMQPQPTPDTGGGG